MGKWHYRMIHNKLLFEMLDELADFILNRHIHKNPVRTVYIPGVNIGFVNPNQSILILLISSCVFTAACWLLWITSLASLSFPQTFQSSIPVI